MNPQTASNRTLLDSSLELKCLFFFGLALTIVVAVSFYLYIRVTEAQIKMQNPQTASLLVEQDMVRKHLGITGKDEGEIDSEFRQMMIEQIITGLRQERFQSRAIRSKYYGNNFAPNSAQDPQSEYEERLLEKFSKPLNHDYEDRIDDLEQYHYYRPIRVSSDGCTRSCHEHIYGDPSLGDLIAIMHVIIPKPPAKNAIEKNWAILLGVAIITAFLSLIAFYIVIRLVIIKPLRALREVAEGISRGDITKRAELQTGDEFESLGKAFNRMLRHLVSTQEKLKSANIELEYKVDELASILMQLHETNRVKSDFMATMSHELRTPLNSILGFSDVLGSISTLNDKQKKYVENINKSGRSLLNMVNDILDMARIESGRMDVQVQSFQIEAIIAAQTDMAKPLLDKKNIDIEIQREENLPPIQQDASRIQQIVNNLLSNAIKFTPEGGRIKISIRRMEMPPVASSYPHTPELATATSTRLTVITSKAIPFLELKVSDTGVGISEEDQQVVFEKFRQARNTKTGSDTMKREYSGSGLGLSIVKELCRMLEGEVELESRLGLGSTFTVRLPWTLEPRPHSESEMMVEIQQFSKTRIK